MKKKTKNQEQKRTLKLRKNHKKQTNKQLKSFEIIFQIKNNNEIKISNLFTKIETKKISFIIYNFYNQINL